MSYGFTYVKNCFYIEDGSGLLSNPLILTDLIQENQFNSLEDYDQALAFQHELNHYIQDLSIGACIVESEFLDYLSAFVKYFSWNESIIFPLADPANREENINLHCRDKNNKVQIDSFYELYDLYKYLFLDKHKKPHGAWYAYDDLSESYFDQYDLSYKDIIEYYAFHKPYWDYFTLASFTKSQDQIQLLHELVKKNNVYPIKWKDGVYYIENAKRALKWNRPYQLLNLLTLIGLPFIDNRFYLDYCENEIPNNYFGNRTWIFHRAQRFIIETALHIPSFRYITKSIKYGKYSKEVFSPVHRFYRAMKIIKDYGGYPDIKDGEDFFITFFDWIAGMSNWPSYKETFESLLSETYERAKNTKEAITNHQFLALYDKYTSFEVFASSLPNQILSKLNLPVAIRTNNSLSVIQFFNQLFSDETYYNPCHMDFYDVMFKSPFISFQNVYLMMTKEAMKWTFYNNGKASIMESIHRILYRAYFDAFVKKGYFCCPFHNHGCPNANPNCQQFTAFSSALENCNKSLFLKNKVRTYRPQGDGNTYDCMFYYFNTEMLQTKTNIL